MSLFPQSFGGQSDDLGFWFAARVSCSVLHSVSLNFVLIMKQVSVSSLAEEGVLPLSGVIGGFVLYVFV